MDFVAPAAALLGVLLGHWIQARNTRQQWGLERYEQRIQQAATDLARLRVFVEEFSPDNQVLFAPSGEPVEFHKRIEQWRPIRPHITRIALLEESVAQQVSDLVGSVLKMIDSTGEGITAVHQNRAVDVADARDAKARALELIEEIMGRLQQASFR